MIACESQCLRNIREPHRSRCPGEPSGDLLPSHLMSVVGVAVFIILLILVLGVLVAKRKRKHGILWLPDGFITKKDGKRREPVGQDDFGLK